MNTQWEAVELRIAIDAKAVEKSRGIPSWLADDEHDVEHAIHFGLTTTYVEDEDETA